MFLTVLLALASTPAPCQQRTDINRQIREGERRIQAIRNEREQANTALTEARGQIRTITSELENLERQKNATTRIVNEIDRQMGFINAQIDTVSVELIVAEDALAEKHAVLERRLVDIYKRGRLWSFQVLVAAESFGDLLSRYKYLSLVSRQDRALVSEVEQLRDRVSGQRQQLVRLRSQLTQRSSDRRDELGRYTALELQRQRALRRAQATQRAATTQLDSLARAEEALNSLLASLEEARRLALARGDRGALGAAITESDLGKLDWPLDGRVIYPFGPNPGPNNTTIPRLGIGIAAAVGTPVRAVAGGIVANTGWLETYGLGVVLDHGGGYYTVYLYLSDIDVNRGDVVSAGDLVGRSGGENSDEGPHIEFQIRSGEGYEVVSLDPVNWLKRRR